MSNQLLPRAAFAILLAGLTVSLACDPYDPRQSKSPFPDNVKVEPLEPPVITGVTPAVASTAGVTLYIRGTGFRFGATVTVAEVIQPAQLINDVLYTSAPPHKEGAVDIVVKNPDGQSHRSVGAFTYASPGSFDPNGDWEGGVDDGSHDGSAIAFRIQNHVLVSLSCKGVDVLPASVVTVVDGAFGSMATGFVGALSTNTDADGRINTTPCLSSVWSARKK